MANDEQHVRRVSGVLLVVVTAALWTFSAVLAGLDGQLADSVPGLATVGFAVLASIVLVRRPDNPLGVLFALIAISLTVLVAGQPYAHHALDSGWPAGEFVAWLSDAAAIPTVGLLVGFLIQLFPSGRPISRGWRWPLYAAGAYVVAGAVGNAFQSQQLESVADHPNPYAIKSLKPLWSGLIASSAVLGAVALVGSVASVIVRWRRAEKDERQQLKWFLAAIAPLPIPLLLHDVARSFSEIAFSFVFALIPIAIGIAILRYRLYDLDLVVSRALGYTLVSAAVAGLYLALVAVTEAATGNSVGTTGHVVAAVVGAAAFHPLRRRLQAAVDRVFYGERSRPYEAVSGLSQRLDAALDPTTVLPTVVDTVASALRLPYVRVELFDAGEWSVAAERGTPTGESAAYPMTYQSELVGRMVVSARSGEDALSVADDRLLTDLARQAGLAAHAVRATTALQRSRAELVTAREEERRRLRRDLHDGLGPALAGVTLGLRAAQVKMSTDVDEAQRLLATLTEQVEEVVADIRRLVYGLRPPALDEFGLVRALQLHASRIEQDGGVRVVINSPPEGLGRLPAAVEVAAYRIVTEALTNVTRHAAASQCEVSLARGAELDVSVSDDGRGFHVNGSAGVGITAMRERAAELGGWLSIEELTPGTRVRARLPVGEDA